MAKSIHWLVALATFGLFGLGLWMRDLGYYSDWYQTAPDLHISIGLLLALVMVLRLVWRRVSPPPAPLASQQPWEHLSALLAHVLMYLLLFGILISGYLIAAADNEPLAIFGWAVVPVPGAIVDNQQDIAGWIHEYLAWGVMVIAGIHALGALKHHFIDGDDTLKTHVVTVCRDRRHDGTVPVLTTTSNCGLQRPLGQ